MRPWWSALALLAALALAGARPVTAEPVATEPEAPQPSERARAVLEAHCAECRQDDANGGPLDLAALADDLRYVVPGRPDASRIYQRLLSLPPAGDDTAKSRPEPVEIEAVRDWIASLPARGAGCHERVRLTPAGIGAHIARWTEAVGVAEAEGSHFLSLAHLWNACVSPARLRDAREATAILLAALARRRAPLELETLGDESALLVVRPGQLPLLAGEWERLIGSAPHTPGAGAVPADWLAAHVLARPRNASGQPDPPFPDPAFEVRFDGAGTRAVAALARSWTGDVDLVRAAAERGIPPRALEARLAAQDGDLLRPARRLLQASLGRADWDRLSRALDGRGTTEGAEGRSQLSDAEIDVLLWSDKPFYRPRDLVSLNVSVSRACHLTLINVDGQGRAIVLFPNDLEPDNLIAPGVTVRVPGHEAGYRLRFERAGSEDIVAVCQRKSRRPEGIAYDYERERFAILGDWRNFLRTTSEREQQIQKRQAAAEARSRRRRGRAPPATEPPAIDPGGPAVEGRAAIRVTIEPRLTP